MFTKLYLETTDPKIELSPNIIKNIFLSAVFHTILYTLFCNTVYYIFFGTILSKIINIRLTLFLFFTMIVGFFARILHVNEIYMAYNQDIERTRNHLDKLYISWIFIS